MMKMPATIPIMKTWSPRVISVQKLSVISAMPIQRATLNSMLCMSRIFSVWRMTSQGPSRVLLLFSYRVRFTISVAGHSTGQNHLSCPPSSSSVSAADREPGPFQALALAVPGPGLLRRRRFWRVELIEEVFLSPLVLEEDRLCAFGWYRSCIMNTVLEILLTGLYIRKVDISFVSAYPHQHPAAKPSQVLFDQFRFFLIERPHYLKDFIRAFLFAECSLESLGSRSRHFLSQLLWIAGGP